jgi:DNA-directed RNA polymerase subunit N (RpoN/RPB10)
MPLIYKCHAVAPPIFPQRCVCGRVIGHFGIKYYQLKSQGKTEREALEQCGLPTCSMFQKRGSGADGDAGGPTPPSACCRARLITAYDPNPSHTIYQHAIASGEGLASVGLTVPSAAIVPKKSS